MYKENKDILSELREEMIRDKIRDSLVECLLNNKEVQKRVLKKAKEDPNYEKHKEEDTVKELLHFSPDELIKELENNSTLSSDLPSSIATALLMQLSRLENSECKDACMIKTLHSMMTEDEKAKEDTHQMTAQYVHQVSTIFDEINRYRQILQKSLSEM